MPSTTSTQRTQVAVLLGREAILGAQDIVTEDVTVPEWGGSVRVTGLTGAERDRFEAAMVTLKKGGARGVNLENIRARMAALAIVDADGQRLFTEADVRSLGGKSAAALERVFKVARRLSGLTEEDVEELAGNSDADPSGSSTSA